MTGEGLERDGSVEPRAKKSKRGGARPGSGRPAKMAASRTLSLRLSGLEYEALNEASRRSGLSRSEYARKLVTTGAAPTRSRARADSGLLLTLRKQLTKGAFFARARKAKDLRAVLLEIPAYEPNSDSEAGLIARIDGGEIIVKWVGPRALELCLEEDDELRLLQSIFQLPILMAALGFKEKDFEQSSVPLAPAWMGGLFISPKKRAVGEGEARALDQLFRAGGGKSVEVKL